MNCFSTIFFKLKTARGKGLIAGILITIFWGFAKISAQTFTDVPVQIPGISGGYGSWGDYDNDGDPDLVIVGDTSGWGHFISRIYRNDNGSFVDINAPIVPVGGGCSAEWGDYDNDGDLDLLLMGQLTDVAGITKIYQNNNGQFTDIGGSLRAFERGKAEWGDYDNDGDLDFVICGASLPNGIYSRVYENMGGNVFNEKNFGLQGVFLGQIGWVDYDLDNDLDIFLTGEDGLNNGVSKLYRNDDSVFVDSGINFTPLTSSFFAWVDVDHDGDPDLVLAGMDSPSSNYSRVLFNNNGVFQNGPILQKLANGSASWGDLDNDQWYDLTFGGFGANWLEYTTVYRNNNSGGLNDINPGFEPIYFVNCLGDYDGDGDLDVALSGDTKFKLYRNDVTTVAPALPIPANLTAEVDRNSARLSWSPEPAVNKMYSYNVRIGTTPGGGEILSGMSDTTGYRLIPKPGNAGSDTSFVIKRLFPGTYYWSVQSVAANYSSSTFAEYDSFTVVFDQNNSRPVVEHFIPNQALVIGRDVFQRNLLSNPVIFSDPEGDPLSFSAETADTLIVSVAMNGAQLNITPLDTGIAIISITASDNIAGGTSVSLIVYSIEMPNKTTFLERDFGFPGLAAGRATWGDFDGDDDLDMVITGINYNTYKDTTAIFRNDGTGFVDINADIPAFSNSDASWGDYDNDNDLDLLVSGYSATAGHITTIYRNDDSVFTDTNMLFTKLVSSVVSWADYDNDGDLDILMTGRLVGGAPVAKLYKNTKAQFTEVPNPFPGVFQGSISWGDYDNDNDLDLLITGLTFTDQVSKIFRNDEHGFTETNIELVQVGYSTSAFGDYDDDGDLDILISGQSSEGPVSKIYQNNDQGFVDILANIKYARGGSVEWGDYDNDGDFDLIVTGYNEVDSTFIASLYENYHGSFVDTEIPIFGADESSCEWGDFDNDGDLDILLAGVNYFFGSFAVVYQNNLPVTKTLSPNTKPNSPENLVTTFDGNDLIISWDKATDAETEQDALTYNIRIGTTPNSNEIMPSMANSQSGYRLMPQSGNANHSTTWRIKNVSDTTIYWTVQAIDNSYAGSEFAPVQQFITAIDPGNPVANQFKLAQNYPNPFNPSTTIEYELPVSGDVELVIYNILGETVRTLLRENQPAGTYTILWDGRNNNGKFAESGIYFCKMKAGNFSEIRKMVLIK